MEESMRLDETKGARIIRTLRTEIDTDPHQTAASRHFEIKTQ